MADQSALQQEGGKGAGGPGLPVWAKLLFLVILAPLIAVLMPTCMLLSLGMIPTAIVYLKDKTREKSFSITVGLTNLCGVLPMLGELWSRGQAMQVATETVSDPLFWMLSFGAAAIGWLIFMGMPPLIAAYYTMASDARIDKVLLRQRALMEMWGEEVAGETEEAVQGPTTTEEGRDPS